MELYYSIVPEHQNTTVTMNTLFPPLSLSFESASLNVSVFRSGAQNFFADTQTPPRYCEVHSTDREAETSSLRVRNNCLGEREIRFFFLCYSLSFSSFNE